MQLDSISWEDQNTKGLWGPEDPKDWKIPKDWRHYEVHLDIAKTQYLPNTILDSMVLIT